MPASDSRHLASFLTVCFFWGLTWVAMRYGVEVLPPVFFAALRFIPAGLIMAAMTGFAVGRLRGRWRRALATALLINTGCYALLFWGIARAPTGLVSIVHHALLPLALLLIGAAFGEERFTRRKLAGIALGFAGLLLLFWPRLAARSPQDEATLWGLLAIVVATLSYCVGSVMSRPLLRVLPPLTLAATHNLAGGLGLLLISLLTESWSGITLPVLLSDQVVLSWLFLVVAGSLIAFTLYLKLVRDWGPSRAGLYSFVSPVIAVTAGLILFDEPFGFFEAAGSAIMLAAAGVALSGRRPSLRGGSPAPKSLD